MAEEDEEKTEEPTAKRRMDARNEGQVAKSMDLNSAVMLFGGLFAIIWFGERFTDLQRVYMLEMFALIPLFHGGIDDYYSLVKQAIKYMALSIWPILLMLLIIGLVSNILQVGLLWTSKPLEPKLSKVFDPKNMMKAFGSRTWIELLKNLIKMIVVTIVAYSVISNNYQNLVRLNDVEVLATVAFILKIVLEMVIKISVLLLVLGVADMAYQRYKTHNEMKMTKQQVKDEVKNTMGDAKMIHARKLAMLKMHQKFMMREVPSATVVITNPTHYAIALRYERGKDVAPLVVAKGVDYMAARIRVLAEENAVPLVENPALARTIYAAVEVGETIPADLFGAVAEILALVFSRQMQPAGVH